MAAPVSASELLRRVREDQVTVKVPLRGLQREDEPPFEFVLRRLAFEEAQKVRKEIMRVTRNLAARVRQNPVVIRESESEINRAMAVMEDEELLNTMLLQDRQPPIIVLRAVWEGVDDATDDEIAILVDESGGLHGELVQAAIRCAMVGDLFNRAAAARSVPSEQLPFSSQGQAGAA